MRSNASLGRSAPTLRAASLASSPNTNCRSAGKAILAQLRIDTQISAITRGIERCSEAQQRGCCGKQRPESQARGNQGLSFRLASFCYLASAAREIPGVTKSAQLGRAFWSMRYAIKSPGPMPWDGGALFYGPATARMAAAIKFVADYVMDHARVPDTWIWQQLLAC